ncbi:MAG: VWA domain-containing protein, partial [Bryobacteraceae bacterium]
MRRTIAILAGAAFAASLTPAQEPAPIRVDVRLINISFSVRDEKGNFVRDLTKDDFEVFDDGAPQKIAFFARASDLPLNLGIVADMSGSQQHFVKQHEHDVKTFLKETLGPRDQAFVLGFGNHLRLISDFSPSAAYLMDRFQQFSPRHKEYGDLPEIAPREIRVSGTAFYDAIYHAIRGKLAPVTAGRRALLIFSDGEDNSSAHHMLDAIEAAQRENVVLYGIRYTEARHGILTARNKYGTSVMSRLSLETGGNTFDAEAGDLKASFREIGDQLRSSYELAYHASQ